MTIWYDFTTTRANTGRSGIANSEWSIARALLSEVPEVRGFCLDEQQRLVEVDASASVAASLYAGSAAGTSVATVEVPAWREAAHRYAMSLGPNAAPLIAVMSKTARRAIRLSRRFRSVQAGRAAVEPSGISLLDAVRREDVVVSMGAVWDGSLAGRLAELRAATGCRVVTMVFDLIPLTHTHLAFHKDTELFTDYYRSMLAASDVVTCISEQSRRDLAAFATEHHLVSPRLEVLHLGEVLPGGTEGREPRDDFFLCVGTVERRKNLELVYDALRIIEMDGDTVPRVVVAGALGWGVDDLVKELSVRSTDAARAISLLGPVDDDTLDRLLRRARGLLFPSHYEGWGLPVREAAIRGCPVAAGDSPAVREALSGYDGGTLLPTLDPGPWADYIRSRPDACTPAPARPWSATARRLLEIVGPA